MNQLEPIKKIHVRGLQLRRWRRYLAKDPAPATAAPGSAERGAKKRERRQFETLDKFITIAGAAAAILGLTVLLIILS